MPRTLYIWRLDSVPEGLDRRAVTTTRKIVGMAKGSNDFRHAQAAWSAARRMIARKDRPCYRVAETGDGATIHVIELPWIAPIEATRRNAIDRAREGIAAWLDVQPDTFDVERE